MAKRKVSPLMTWAFWGILVLGIFFTVTREYFVAGFAADSSMISILILVFFAMGLLSSLWVASYLQKEFNALKRMDTNQRIGNAAASDAAAMLDAALECIRRGDRIDTRNLVSAYGAKIKARVEHISVIAGMLITIGLLGTVLGLIMTITGLDNVLKASANDYAAMKAGLNETVAGMGTAFYTTFYGALLGGVVLKVLAAEMRKSGTHLVADTMRFTELFIAPKTTEAASETLAELESRVAGIGRDLEQLGSSVGGVIDTINSKQTSLADGLGDLVETVGRSVEATNEQANERIGALVASVDTAIRQSDERIGALVQMVEEANRRADERMGLVTSSFEQTVSETTRHADERIEALVAVSRSTIETTNRTSEEQLGALVQGIDQIMNDTHRKADERLEALTLAINQTTEETHRMADERLGALLGTVESAAEDTHRKANDRLVELVDQVGVSIDQTRRQAEERLGTKASDLAQKLTEAASVLAALSEASEAESGLEG